jgi:ATP-dependent DNA ligase
MYNADEWNGLAPLPTLYAKTATGATNVWSCWIEGYYVHVKWGQLDGAMQEASYVCAPKNVGRANSTTAQEQARLEAISKWKKQLKKKYFMSEDDAQGTLNLKPMLAKDFKKAKRVKFPADVQPKLDGVRCITYWQDGKLIMQSRGGDPYIVPHIHAQLEDALKNHDLVLDGELYVHENISLQTITSWVKRLQPDTARLHYVLYDITDQRGQLDEWDRRREKLKLWFEQSQNDLDECVELLETHEVSSADEVKRWHDDFVQRGYEGAIVRVRDERYRFGYRSSGLLKFKQFQDAEFTIVGFTTGKGKFSEYPIFRCVTSGGKEFDVMPTGTDAERRQMLIDAPQLIGGDMTVRFFDWTDDGVPHFPVGVGPRPKGV